MSVAAAQSGAILERLLSLHPKRIDLVLDRIERLLAETGVWAVVGLGDNPQRPAYDVGDAAVCAAERGPEPHDGTGRRGSGAGRGSRTPRFAETHPAICGI